MFRLTRINSDAALTVSYYIASAWTAYASIDNLMLDASQNLVSPTCEGIRLRATYATAREIDRAQLTLFSVISGATFTVRSGDGTTMVDDVAPVAQTVKAFQGGTSNELFRYAASTQTVHEIEASGFTAQAISLKAVVFGSNGFSTDKYNYDYGHTSSDTPDFAMQKTQGTNFAEVDDSSRDEALNLADLTKLEADKLAYFLAYQCVKGLCLFERSVDSVQDVYMAVVTKGRTRHDYFIGYSTSLNVLEKHACL